MTKDWRELSEAASREQDPKKLLELVEQLDKALEERESTLKEKKRADYKSRLEPLPISHREPHSHSLCIISSHQIASLRPLRAIPVRLLDNRLDKHKR
jgi:hypothetical protein